MKNKFILFSLVGLFCLVGISKADDTQLIQKKCYSCFNCDSNSGFRGCGPRVGVSVNPDQIHFGAHVDFGDVSNHIRFQPNVELGLGDNFNLLTLNGEFSYRFVSCWDAWSPYLGAGVGLNTLSNDNKWKYDTHNTEVGYNLLAGLERGLSNGDRFFVEGKWSLNDIPDFKATIGWTFCH